MTHLGSCISPKGKRPVVGFQHRFKYTYLFGSYSPMDGQSFVWEIDGVDNKIFESYLHAFSKQRPREFKIVVIDNAGFHSTKNITVPDNIYLLAIPPYSPELNPCEQIWQFIKNRFKNSVFSNLDQLKDWLHQMVNSMEEHTIKSITSNHHYLQIFNATF